MEYTCIRQHMWPARDTRNFESSIFFKKWSRRKIIGNTNPTTPSHKGTYTTLPENTRAAIVTITRLSITIPAPAPLDDTEDVLVLVFCAAAAMNSRHWWTAYYQNLSAGEIGSSVVWRKWNTDEDLQQEALSRTRNTSRSDYRPCRDFDHLRLRKSILDHSFERGVGKWGCKDGDEERCVVLEILVIC